MTVGAVLARSADNVGIDIVLAGLPFEARVIARATPWSLGNGRSLQTCSAEDLLAELEKRIQRHL